MRQVVFDLIAAHLDNVRIHCVVVDKARIVPARQTKSPMYRRMLGYLPGGTLTATLDTGADRVIVTNDTMPVNKKRKAVEKSIQGAVARNQLPGLKFRILHHQSRSRYGL